MHPSPDALRALADRVRRIGAETRDEAVRLLRAAEDVPWEGLSAEAYRRHARRRAGELVRAADLHDEAAAALDRHARAVQCAAQCADAVVDVVAGAVHAIQDAA